MPTGIDAKAADMIMRTPRIAALLLALALAAPACAGERSAWAANAPGPARATAAKQQAPRPATCASPDGPQPEGTVRCEMCPAAPGARIQYRPMACTAGKWTEAGPCADGDCAGRTY
jgi:hypothetical protein